jgi:hypothetical protein
MNPSVSFAHLVSRVSDERRRPVMRYIGLDVHREFCEVAISEEGKVRSAGRVRTRREELELFAQSLGSDDEVALETTGGAEAIAAILRAQVARVVVVNTKKLRAISEAKAPAGWPSSWPPATSAEVWCPDERTRALRRYVARRAQLVRQRSRAKNEIAAALQRNLFDRPGVYTGDQRRDLKDTRISSANSCGCSPGAEVASSLQPVVVNEVVGIGTLDQVLAPISGGRRSR